MSSASINGRPVIQGPGLKKQGVVVLQTLFISFFALIELIFRHGTGSITGFFILLVTFGAIRLGRKGTRYVSVVTPPLALAGIVIMYSVLLFSVIDGFFLSRKIKSEVQTRFPGKSTKGLGLYGWLRSTQMRRMRAPKPQIKAGDKY